MNVGGPRPGFDPFNSVYASLFIPHPSSFILLSANRRLLAINQQHG